LEDGHDVVERLLEDLHRLLAALLLDLVQRLVHDMLRHALLAAGHHLVDQPAHRLVPEHRVRPGGTARDRSLPRHRTTPPAWGASPRTSTGRAFDPPRRPRRGSPGRCGTGSPGDPSPGP